MLDASRADTAAETSANGNGALGGTWRHAQATADALAAELSCAAGTLDERLAICDRVAYRIGELIAHDLVDVGDAADLIDLAATSCGLHLEAGADAVQESMASGFRDGAAAARDERAAAETTPIKVKAPKKTWRDYSISAAALQTKVFAPVNMILDGMLTEGLTILAGRPKLGKSWLALDWCLGVAGGEYVMGSIKPSCEGDVLYLALEDNQRRLQKRCTKLRGAFKGQWPERLTLVTEYRRLDKGGLQDLEDWLKEAADPKLIVVDTLQKVRPIKANSGYQEDYGALEALQALAGRRNVAIVILHHTRKMEAEDPLDAVSGTLGLVGSADTTLVLDRNAQGVTLYGRGRDIETFERAMRFETDTCRWRMLGDAVEVRRSDTRNSIIKVLDSTTEPMTVTEIADEVDLPKNTVKQRLRGMVTDGQAQKVGRGSYARGIVTAS